MAMNSSDEVLMIAVREGASAELAVLFDRHHRALYEFFFRMTGERAQSENLVQEVFNRILKFRDTFREEGRFRAWLYRIARNVHHDHCRKFLSAHTVPSPTVPSSNVRAESLRRTLLAMPEDRRELIVFSQYQRLSPHEIAELLDIEPPDAKARIHRAMMELSEQYRKSSNGTSNAN